VITSIVEVTPYSRDKRMNDSINYADVSAFSFTLKYTHYHSSVLVRVKDLPDCINDFTDPHHSRDKRNCVKCKACRVSAFLLP